MRCNLEVTGAFAHDDYLILWDPLWKNSLLLLHKNSLLEGARMDLFLILKSYVENEFVVVDSLFFTLENITSPYADRRVLQKIPLFEIVNLKDLYAFSAWWDVVARKVWQYETMDKRVGIIFNLNGDNVWAAFGLTSQNLYKLTPIYPWKETLKNDLIIKHDTILKLKSLLKNSRNYSGDDGNL